VIDEISGRFLIYIFWGRPGAPPPFLIEVVIMELDIHNIGTSPVQRQKIVSAKTQQGDPKTRKILSESRQKAAPVQQNKEPQFDPEVYLKDIVTISNIFRRRLKFIVNHNTNQVIVKVVDGDTDKVIKEIPPEALQRLHSRMREAIGLLIDEEI